MLSVNLLCPQAFCLALKTSQNGVAISRPGLGGNAFQLMEEPEVFVGFRVGIPSTLSAASKLLRGPADSEGGRPICGAKLREMGMGQNYTVQGPQVFVFGSILRGNPFWGYPSF